MSTVAGRYPKEFKEDVIRVARDRGPGETLEQIAHDFGVHPVTLSKWLKQADIEDGVKPGVTKGHADELREARRRIRRLEQENEVLRRAAAYLSQANLPGKALPARERPRGERDRGRGLPTSTRLGAFALLPVAGCADHRFGVA